MIYGYIVFYCKGTYAIVILFTYRRMIAVDYGVVQRDMYAAFSCIYM